MKSPVILWKKKKPHNSPGVISFECSREHCQWKQRETNAGVVIWNLTASVRLWNQWPFLTSMSAKMWCEKLAPTQKQLSLGRAPGVEADWCASAVSECVVAIGARRQLLTMLDGSYGSRARSHRCIAPALQNMEVFEWILSYFSSEKTPRLKNWQPS